ncbi:respiratory nitrate reductase alpha subunit apoprotein [Corynebacterium pollutisoli]|uniref:nitrate reductase (quinone) n=1 Tax=Corynebacterium pollutisoli TaxID=1610489 RepID=A0A1X7JMR3_9CORY|nr:nitrate reductase subunit alpha [Corynebacterium pollutisoli]SMG28715.1 respiratory nitrate reductase alpha subunit apoprotein [Corynebacterium pollutisoli]
MTTTSSANPLFKFGSYLRKGQVTDSGQQLFLKGGRQADVFYRNRWSFDKMVRSTHGVNCTGSCSWKVYVKDGVITWESQAVDYPTTGPDMPDYEPRGCPRGASFSWYTYSPTRIRYPYARGVLVDMYREAKERLGDPVLAWREIVETPEKRHAYVSQRGKGGLIRIPYDEAVEIAAAAHVYTIRQHGPDRIAGFTVIPAMSQVSYGAGTRFLQMIGGVALSFYDWYADLPPASPQTFGDQTDVPESGDWYNSSYLMMWGSNIPVTRTPDAHFMVESRYKGTKVVVVSPDFADNTRFADEWLRINPGTDAALAFAMGHVILSEFHVGEKTPYFLNYMRKYTDSPFLISLDERADGTLTPGKFLTASQLADAALRESPNATHRLMVMQPDGSVVDPGGTVADRWGEEGVGKWNLRLDDVDPVMSVAETGDYGTAEVLFPRFDLDADPADVDGTGPIGAGVVRRGVPYREIDGHKVTTVFDVMLAHYGVARPELGLPGEWPTDFHDASTPGTPAWQEELTGVPANAAIRIGREFARNAEQSEGRSQIIMGAGVNHYFHADNIYRTFLALTSMCGTQGVNGGGWAHYVGQEKLRPMNGWSQYAFALDWQRPARQMITTGFYYLTTDQWRYDNSRASRLASPLANRGVVGDKHLSDTLIESMKRGWMPAYPQFNRNPLLLADEAAAKGISVQEHVAEELNSGRMQFAAEDPDAPENWPRILLNWRTNLMGSSAKGTEFFLRHMLGVDSDATAVELGPEERPESIAWRDEAPVGKLDLMLTTDFRNTSTTLVSDIVLPAATWYEKNDLSTTDMHPFIHSFNAAINPPWEARTDFEVFRDLSKSFSALAGRWLGTQTDLITSPLGHDSPDELSMPNGIVPDLAETGYVPGKTMAKLIPVERDYSKVYEKWTHLGPLTAEKGTGVHGTAYNVAKQVEELALLNGTSETSSGERPDLDTATKVIEMILHLSGVSNGEVAAEGFRNQGARVGTDMMDLIAGNEGDRIGWDMVKERPAEVITSPEWTGSKKGGRRYTAFSINLEYDKPFHTLSGRMHYYLDHDWFLDYGEALPVFRPPLDRLHLNGETNPGELVRGEDGNPEVTVRYLTPHNKWSIHSQYFDNLHVLSISRGGQVVWMSDKDAAKIGVADNEWIEVYNRNGIVSARAIVSHRIPEGTAIMNHAQERTVGTPLNENTGRRGGTHNSLTRIMIKPVHVAGGYGHLTYGFNYIGPTGNNRDEVTRIRRRSQEVQF